MDNSKYLGSCIQILKGVLGDQSNELESEQQRALGARIRKLKKLKKQSKIDPAELYAIVEEIAEAVFEILECPRPK
jgi:hypothetical protein